MSEQQSHSHVKYSTIFFALCGCTVLSILFDFVDLREKNLLGLNGVVLLSLVVLSIACAKALFVMIYFMHLKFEGNWKYVLLAPTTILAIGLPLALYPDVGIAYYTPTAPQIHQWGDEFAEYKEAHAKHDEQHVEPEPAASSETP